MKNCLWIIILTISIKGLIANIYDLREGKSSKDSTLNPICELSGTSQFFVTNPSDCRGWLGCFYGNAYKGFCEEGYYFNEENQNCDYEKNVKCKIIKNDLCDGDNEGHFIEHLSDCRGWFWCSNGNALEGFCPEGYFFNVEDQTCDFPENVFCPWIPTTTTTVNPLCENVPNGAFISDATSCDGWIWCSNGNAFKGICPEGYYFNEDDQTCDFPENVNCPWNTPTPPTPTTPTTMPETTTPILPETTTDVPITTTTLLPDTSTTEIITTTTVLPEITTTVLPETTTTVLPDTTTIIPDTTTTIVTETTTTTILPDTTTTTVPDTTTTVPDTTTTVPDTTTAVPDITTTTLPDITTTTMVPDTTTTTLPDITTTTMVPETTTTIISETTTTIIPETTTTIIPETTNTPDITTTVLPETTTINPEVFNPCKDQPDNTFVASLTRCNGWFHCKSGIATEGSCRTGLHFDPINQKCDLPDNVNCTIVELCNGVFDREFIADPTDCQGWYRCEAEQAFHGLCPAGFHFSEATQLCDYPENAHCSICTNIPYGQFVLDKTNCQGFYLCRNNIPTWGICPNGFYFNETLQGCDLKEYVMCPINPICNGFAEGHLLAYPRNCQKFYRCNREETIIDQCPAGFYFTEEHQACDYPSNVECAVNPICVDIEDNIKISNPLDCRNWYLCVNGIASEGSCPANYSFSELYQDCVPSETFDCPVDFLCLGVQNGKFVPDPNDCNGWYLCDSGKAINGSCPDGFYFTELHQACDYPENVGCITIITPPTNPPPTNPPPSTTTAVGPTTTTAIPNPCQGLISGTMIDDPTLCATYFFCYNNQALPMQCKDGKVFNPVICACDDNENVKCFDEVKRDRCYKKPDNTFLSHQMNCDKWILCINDESIEGTCPTPFLFNSIKQICDFPYNVECLNDAA